MMSLYEFITKYFNGWKIAGVTTCGNTHGHLKLRDGETKIKIYFFLHGARHWTESCVTIDFIKGDNETIF